MSDVLQVLFSVFLILVLMNSCVYVGRKYGSFEALFLAALDQWKKKVEPLPDGAISVPAAMSEAILSERRKVRSLEIETEILSKNLPIRELCDRLASLYGWEFICFQPKSTLLSYGRTVDDVKQRINVYYTNMTIGTSLEHPIKGKTQLFRRHVTDELLAKIFENPRTHTNKGYRFRR